MFSTIAVLFYKIYLTGVLVFGIIIHCSISIEFIQNDTISHINGNNNKNNIYNNNNNSYTTITYAKRNSDPVADDGDDDVDIQNLTTSLKVLSRKRRYVAFPEGSSFSVAVCATVGVIGNPDPSYMSFGLNWGIAYDLPNVTWILDQLHGTIKRRPLKQHHFKENNIISSFPSSSITHHRRVRRELFNKIESIIDNFGYNGRNCILRMLCEVTKYFQKIQNGTMIEEMIKVIFSFPKHKVYSFEHDDIRKYDMVIRRATMTEYNSNYCLNYRNDCNFSLLDLFIGKYSEPSWYS